MPARCAALRGRPLEQARTRHAPSRTGHGLLDLPEIGPSALDAFWGIAESVNHGARDRLAGGAPGLILTKTELEILPGMHCMG